MRLKEDHAARFVNLAAAKEALLQSTLKAGVLGKILQGFEFSGEYVAEDRFSRALYGIANEAGGKGADLGLVAQNLVENGAQQPGAAMHGLEVSLGEASEGQFLSDLHGTGHGLGVEIRFEKDVYAENVVSRLQSQFPFGFGITLSCGRNGVTDGGMTDVFLLGFLKNRLEGALFLLGTRTAQGEAAAVKDQISAENGKKLARGLVL